MHFLRLRHRLVPVANITSNASWMFIMIGIIFSSMNSMLGIGIALLAVGVVFQIVTLPVEFNASSRAMNQMVSLRCHSKRRRASRKESIKRSGYDVCSGSGSSST